MHKRGINLRKMGMIYSLVTDPLIKVFFSLTKKKQIKLVYREIRKRKRERERERDWRDRGWRDRGRRERQRQRQREREREERIDLPKVLLITEMVARVCKQELNCLLRG